MNIYFNILRIADVITLYLPQREMQSKPFGFSLKKSLNVFDNDLIYHLSGCLLHQNVRICCQIWKIGDSIAKLTQFSLKSLILAFSHFRRNSFSTDITEGVITRR